MILILGACAVSGVASYYVSWKVIASTMAMLVIVI